MGPCVHGVFLFQLLCLELVHFYLEVRLVSGHDLDFVGESVDTLEHGFHVGLQVSQGVAGGLGGGRRLSRHYRRKLRELGGKGFDGRGGMKRR